MRHLAFLLAALALTACDAKGTGSEDTDASGTNPDDTDAADTDVVDTDTQDTDVNDTDIPPDYAKVPFVHAGIYTLDSYLHFHDLVVTAVRYRATPPASNGVIVQDPAYVDNAGLYIDLDNTQTLPEVGDLLDFVGVYVEDPIGGAGVDALSTIVIDPIDSASYFTITGSADLPDPVTLTLDDLLDSSVAETYESMRIHVEGPINVVSNLNGYGEVKLASVGGSEDVQLSPRFYDFATGIPTVANGDSFADVDGVLFWERNAYKIATTAPGDLLGYTQP
jgi:hypothetical protein